MVNVDFRFIVCWKGSSEFFFYKQGNSLIDKGKI